MKNTELVIDRYKNLRNFVFGERCGKDICPIYC